MSVQKKRVTPLHAQTQRDTNYCLNSTCTFSSRIERKQDWSVVFTLSKRQSPATSSQQFAKSNVCRFVTQLLATLSLEPPFLSIPPQTSPPTVFPRCSPPFSSSSRKFNYQQRVSGHVRVIIRRITTSKRRLNGLLCGIGSPADSIGKSWEKFGSIRLSTSALYFASYLAVEVVEEKLLHFFLFVVILNFGSRVEKVDSKFEANSMDVLALTRFYFRVKRYKFIEIYRLNRELWPLEELSNSHLNSRWIQEEGEGDGRKCKRNRGIFTTHI